MRHAYLTGRIASMSMCYANHDPSESIDLFRDPGEFRDGVPSVRDTRKFLLANLKAAVAVLENPK